jgi:hypothetical protein
MKTAKLLVIGVLGLTLTGCHKDKVEELIPQLPVNIVSANLFGADVTADVFAKCSNPAVLGYCDYDPKYTGQPTARFTATYTCGSSPELYVVSLGDNGFETGNSNSSNDVFGQTVRISCTGTKLNPEKKVTIVSATFGTINATKHVQAMCAEAVGVCNYQPRLDYLGNPYPNRSVRMTIEYRCGTSAQTKIAQFGQNDTGDFGKDATSKILSAQCP